MHSSVLNSENKQVCVQAEMVGVTWKGSKSRTSVGEKATSSIQSVRQEARRPSEPAISFRDKESYQQLFKPLPKPEPIPQLTPFKVNLFNPMSVLLRIYIGEAAFFLLQFF